MKYYDINVVGQEMTITNTSRSMKVIEGSQKFVKFRFNLDSDWDDLTVFAQFIQNGQAYNIYLDDNGVVELPPEIVKGKCLIVLYGSGSSVIATVNAISFTVGEYKLIADDKSIAITKTLYDQMIDYVNNHTSEVETALAEAMEDFDAQVDGLMAMVGTPLQASIAADMINHNKIYVYTGSESGYNYGHWYYWDGSAWVSGGVYNSSAFNTDKTLAVEDMAADAKYVGDAIDDVRSDLSDLEDSITDLDERKAEIDGYYDTMTVGTAEQLLSSLKGTDQVPYKFRTAGGSLEIGDRENDMLVGGSIVWNQLCQPYTFTTPKEKNGVTITNNNDGTLTVTGTCTADDDIFIGNVIPTNTLKKNHVYYSPRTNTGKYGLWNGYDVTSISKFTFSDAGLALYYKIKNGTTYNEKIYVNYFDLTQMFGSTIADYIYSLEQATVGAGVAWFKKYFPKDYYEYNAGSLISVSGLQSHKMVGFNQWDEKWELGTIDRETGKISPSVSGEYFCSKNFIPVFELHAYSINNTYNNGVIIFAYADEDSDGMEIPMMSTYGSDVVTFTIPNGFHFIKFAISNYGTTYKNDICIYIHWDDTRNGEYEPYTERVYPLDNSLTLRGILKLDNSNQLYYDGDTYESDGTVTRKYGIVDLGTLNWSYSSNRFQGQGVTNFKTGTRVTKIICPKYDGKMNSEAYDESWDKVIYFASNYVNIHDSAYSDAATFKTAMSGVYLVYELAEPTTEHADPFQDPQIVDNWGTEEYISTSLIPIGHITKYSANLRDKIEAAPDIPDYNGDYILRKSGSDIGYTPLIIPNEIPVLPYMDGNYRLVCSVSDGFPTLSWEEITS